MNMFLVEDSLLYNGYKITMSPALWNRLDGVQIDSSWLILLARLFNLSYPNFLRFVRDKHNATLWGKDGYISFYFKERKDAQFFAKIANDRIKLWLRY